MKLETASAKRGLLLVPKDLSVKTSQVYLLFTASGATALIYQVIWSRSLGLLFGSTTSSVSIVLGSFMLGLALGSWGAGRFLHRIRNPLRAYAFLELGIGIFALCFSWIFQATDYAFTMAVSTDSSAAFSLFARASLAFTLLLVPTTFMGATLPLLTEFFYRSPGRSRTWKVGLLYAANTLGAAAGIILAGFVTIELLGVQATTLGAALLNFSVGFLGLKLARSPFPVLSKTPDGGRLNWEAKLAIAVLTASGGAALASEVLWTRTLETVVANSTYAFSMIVLLYLLGIAAGSWLMSLAIKRLKHLPLWMASMQLGMGLWILVALVLFNGLVGHISRYQDTMVSVPVLLWNYCKVVSILLPLSLLSGACFPLATRIIHPTQEEAKGFGVARAYTWNTAGAVIGSLLAGAVIGPRFDYFASLYVIALLYCLASFLAYLIIGRLGERRPPMRTAAIGLAVVSLFPIALAYGKISGSGDFLARFNARAPLYQVVYHKAGLQGVTTVIQSRNGHPLSKALLVNGMGMTVKVTDTKMMAHLPMLLHPDPQDTLVICFGMGTTYRSAITHGGRVTAVELVEEVLEAFDFFYQDAPRVRGYAKGRMLVNDGRSYLKLTREKYDVITIDPPPPIDAAGVNHLYSREFYELARSRLKKGGILAQWIPYPGRKAGVDDMGTMAMLVRTFADVFPCVYVKSGVNHIGMHVLGSHEPLDMSPDLIRKRLSNREVADDLMEWEPVPFSYFQGIERLRPATTPVRLVTDDRPMLEFYLLGTWQKAGKKNFPANYWSLPASRASATAK